MSNAFSNRVGLTIEEGIANALSVSSGVSTHNIGLLTERERGLANPTLITSLKEDVKYFGGHSANKYSSHVVENLFNNCGGFPVNIYQCRVVGEGSTPAKATVKGTIGGGQSDLFTVIAGRQGQQDVGDWGNELSYKLASTSSPSEVTLQVYYQGYLVETFKQSYSATNILGKALIDLIADVNKRSEYVYIIPNGVTEESVVSELSAIGILTGGVYIKPTKADFMPKYHQVTEEALGMAKFDAIDVQIIACPEIFDIDFVQSCATFAENNSKLFVFNMPYLATESVIESYYSALVTSGVSAVAGYLEWAQVTYDTNGSKVWIPSIGYVLGSAYVRKVGLYNGQVWTPPAGTETYAKGVHSFTHQDITEDKRGRYTKVWRCNTIKYIQNVGFCVWTSRTYSNNQLFESIHIRLETIWILANLEVRNASWMQKILSPTMVKSIVGDNKIWFKNLYENGGIEQSISFDDAVIINMEISKENRKDGELDIYWIPPECLEHLHIRVSRNDGVLINN